MLDLTPGSGKLHITQLWSWKARRGNFILDPWSLQDPSHWYLCWWWWWLLGTVGNGPSWWVWNDYDVSIAFVKNIYGFRMWWTISDAWRWEKIGKHIRSHNIHIHAQKYLEGGNDSKSNTHHHPLVSTHIIGIFVDGDGFSSVQLGMVHLDGSENDVPIAFVVNFYGFKMW